MFVLATVVPPSAGRMMERSSLQSLHLSLLPARAKQHRSAEQVPLPLAKARTTRQLQLQANLREAADWRPPLLGSSEAPLVRANPQMKANLKPSEKRLVQARHLAAQAKPQEMQRQLEEDSAVLQARARRCSRCPVPCAFSPETPGARKCNREARCGGYPIPARYPLPRIRDALADCDNKRSRSQRKRARRAGTFPIAAADKCLCLPRRTAD